MIITSSIPNGNGRIRRITANHTEVELIAYSKGSRYFCIEISDIDQPHLQEITLVPDSLFREKTFPYKRHSDVWIYSSETSCWKRIEKVEKTPEQVRFQINLVPGNRYLISSEPPRSYSETTSYLHHTSEQFSDICSIHNIGFSMEHRPLFALRVSEQKTVPGKENLPVIHIVAGEHATEFAGEEIARGMLAFVLSDSTTTLRRDFIFDFILNANPDGNIHGWHQYNLRDWRGHNYHDNIDRSWHHEFLPYIQGKPDQYSPETIALMEWLKLTRPSCYLSMHSWEGQNGNPGAFHPPVDELTAEMGSLILNLNQIAQQQAQDLGFSFIPYPSKNDRLHLGHFLMCSGIAIAYLPEGNYAVGREKLQQFGAGLLQNFLRQPPGWLQRNHRSRWNHLQ